MPPRLNTLLFFVTLTTLVMLPRLLNLDTFVGPDELAIWGWGNKFALVLSQGKWDQTLIGDGYPAVTLMWLHTTGITLKWLWMWVSGVQTPFEQVIGLDRPVNLYAERRLFLSLFSGLQILAAYPLIRIIWNHRIAAVAVGIMAIEPMLLAFTRMIRADALLAHFMLLSILATLAFIKTGQQRYNWLAGAMGGLAALSKFVGGITAVVAIVIYVWVAWHRIRQKKQAGSLRWLILAVLRWGLTAAVFFFGLWPAWWTQPVDTFNLIWGKVQFHAVEATTSRATTYFWGTIHPFGPGVGFYPVWAWLHLTPWLLLGSLAALGRCIWLLSKRRFDQIDPYEGAVLFSVIVYWLAITLPGQKYDRYLLPVIPGLSVLTAVELVRMVDWLGQQRRRNWPQLIPFKMLPQLTVVGLGLLAIGYVALYHPLYSTYFNPLSGPPSFWQWALPIGQGEGVDKALQYLSTLPEAATKMVVCGTNLPRCQPYFVGQLYPQENLRSGQWIQADYVLWHIDEQQQQVFPAGVLAYLRRQPLVYVARYHGLEYTWLYPVPQPTFLSGSKLEGVATLLGYDPGHISLSESKAGQKLRLHIYWQNEGQAHQQQFWWRVVDDMGYIWSQAEVQPLSEFEPEVSQKGAIIEGEVELLLPSDIPPGSYRLQAGFANANGDVGQFSLPPTGSLLTVKTLPVGPSNPTFFLNTKLTPQLRLRGYDLSDLETTPGDTVWVAFHWQANGMWRRDDEQLTVHLLDQESQEVAAWSKQPIYHIWPADRWPANFYVRDPWLLTLPSTLAAGQYHLTLNLNGPESSPEVKPAQVNLQNLTIVKRKSTFKIPMMQFQAGESFNNLVTLLGYDLSGILSDQGAQAVITLYWQAEQNTPQPYRVNLRLVDTNGVILAEQGSEPANGAAPTTEWQPGEVVADQHEVKITGLPGSPVQIEVRLLDANNQPVTLRNGAAAFIIAAVQEKVNWQTAVP
jgi:4-amino-4-deoxy-L-arabinose transferase-like glycosyltransferase